MATSPAPELDRRLLDRYQRGLPLVPRPYAAMAGELGVTEGAVIAALDRLAASGALARIGAVVAPRRAGHSTLAAMAVPPARLDAVAALVNSFPGVNHNYEREHAVNLWFVVTGADEGAVATVLGEIERRSGLAVLDLPLEAAHHIDLGFALEWN